MDQEKIGHFIAEIRKKKGFTQRELGEKVGIGYRSVSKWEQGITVPDISIIPILAKKLDVTIDELLNGEYCQNSIQVQAQKSKKHLDYPIDRAIKLLTICISIQTVIIIILLIIIAIYLLKNY